MLNKVPIVSEPVPRLAWEGETPPSRTYTPGGPDHSSNPSYTTVYLIVSFDLVGWLFVFITVKVYLDFLSSAIFICTYGN